MLTAYKNITSLFFIALWAISQMFQFGHEVSHHMLDQHHEGCSHHHHNEVKPLDRSSDSFTVLEVCAICDFEWFNPLKAKPTLFNSILAIPRVQVKLGHLSQALVENWISRSLIPRGPPSRS